MESTPSTGIIRVYTSGTLPEDQPTECVVLLKPYGKGFTIERAIECDGTKGYAAEPISFKNLDATIPYRVALGRLYYFTGSSSDLASNPQKAAPVFAKQNGTDVTLPPSSGILSRLLTWLAK